MDEGNLKVLNIKELANFCENFGIKQFKIRHFTYDYNILMWDTDYVSYKEILKFAEFLNCETLELGTYQHETEKYFSIMWKNWELELIGYKHPHEELSYYV